MRLFFRVFGVVFLIAAIVAAYNFFSLAPLNEPRGRDVVCAKWGSHCKAVMTRLFRTPLWTDMDFRVSGQTVQVRCARAAYWVGEYRCARR
jgi:hypothetical protein